MCTRRGHGFTLIELMVTLAVFAVLLMIAVPSMRPFLLSQSIKSASMDLNSTVALARSEAIKRNAVVAVTPVDTTDWSKGWSVAQSGTVIRSQDALSNITMTPGSATGFSFDGSGRMITSPDPTFAVRSIDATTGPGSLCLSVLVSGSGRVKTTKVTCS